MSQNSESPKSVLNLQRTLFKEKSQAQTYPNLLRTKILLGRGALRGQTWKSNVGKGGNWASESRGAVPVQVRVSQVPHLCFRSPGRLKTPGDLRPAQRWASPPRRDNTVPDPWDEAWPEVRPLGGPHPRHKGRAAPRAIAPSPRRQLHPGCPAPVRTPRWLLQVFAGS